MNGWSAYSGNRSGWDLFTPFLSKDCAIHILMSDFHLGVMYPPLALLLICL